MQKPFYSSTLQTTTSRRAVAGLRLLLLTCLLGLGSLSSTWASHFRYGDISWRVVQSDVSGRTIEFKVNAGWRLSAANSIYLNFGDGSGADANVVYTNINNAYDYGTGTVQHRYNGNGNFTAYYSGGNKIGDLQNNANGSWYVSSVVNVGAGNSSPVSTVPAVVNMPIGLANARFIVPAADPDGRALSFRLAAGTGDWYGVQPSGLSINAQTGEITFNTVGKSAGLLYNAGVIISNGRTEVLVDFIIQTVQQSNPPQFDYAVTPANQQVINVSPGQPVNFSVKATCVDAGSTVRLSAVGIPAGAVVSPAFGVYANPVQHSFSWTPAANQFGTFVVNFVAESNVGAQTSTSVSILVSLKPRFDVPPTPPTGVAQVFAPGQLISQTIQASNGDPTDLVRIIGAQEKIAGGALVALPAGAGLSPLPTMAANPTSGTFTWTPAASSWGEHTVMFTAAESRNEQATHEVSYLINTVPAFTSAPVTRADVGQPYTYNVTVNDPDLTYGDAVNFVPTFPLPAWLTLTSSPATGTAVLSGTPPASAAGTLTVYLQAEDINHHAYATTPEQVFTITINNCTVQAVAQNVTVLLDASGAATVTAAQVDNGSTASCGVASVQVSPSAFTCANQGTNPVTLTVTDANGNVSTASANVTVVDNILPTISAPAPVVASTDAGQCRATGVALGNATAADNCSATVTNDAPATFAKGTTTVTWTATDAAGNVATATQTVTVNDTEKPVLTVPANLVANAPATQCGAVVNFTPTATDNCAGATVMASPASGSTFPVGTSTVTVTATDASGNTSTGSFTVTVKDVTAPAVTVRTVTVTLVNGAASVSAADVNNGSSDACGIASYSLNRSAFDCNNIGNNAVVLTVTDIHGNVASAPATVTVVGSIPTPTISVTPTSNVYTGGVATNLYLGYGSQSATLTAKGGVSYAWSPASGLSSTTVANPVFTATTAGTFTYTVTATSQYGCTATKTVTLRVVDARCDKNKVVVCHNGHEICISPNAVPAHLGGHPDDQLGACGTASRPAAPAPAPAPTAELATELVFEAYPNPFGASTTVHFRPTVSAAAQIRVFDAVGRVVGTLFSGTTEAGHDYALTLDGTKLATGLYLCRYESQGQVHTQRLSVVK
ncbi:HYR domain-containing protein [Hymenobacter sp. UYCo722]|uniref:HYR domain-containing protein n=1 Tax=Hymenobacter sp. UYCo722 TaxID=3156335 RepID=UPI00339B8FA1